MLRTLQKFQNWFITWIKAFWFRFCTSYSLPGSFIEFEKSTEHEALESIIRILIKKLAENLDPYGGDGKLGEDDFEADEIFKLFKNPEKMVKQFITWNKKTYKQGYRTEAAGFSRDEAYEDAMEFINEYHRALGSPTVHGGKVLIKQWTYLFGIPVLVVQSLPWDDPGDEVWELGNFFNNFGIITVEHDDVLETVEHEIVHAMVAWLKAGKFYALDPEVSTLQALFLRSDSMLKKALKRYRNECIPYMVANPGRLAKREEDLLIRSLTGRDKKTLAENMNQQDYDLIIKLCGIAQGIDDNRHILSRIIFCQTIMKYAEIHLLAKALAEKSEQAKAKGS